MSVLPLALKDIRLLSRDKAGLFWVLGFPVLMSFLFGAMFANRSQRTMNPLPVALVDEDRTDSSKKFTETLGTSGAVKILSVADPRDEVRQGHLAAYILIKKGFGSALGNGEPQVDLVLDPSKHAEVGILKGVLVESAFKSMAPKAESNEGSFPGLSELNRIISGSVQPPKINMESVAGLSSNPKSSYEISFPLGIVWGLIGCVSTFTMAFVRERTGGTLVRLRLSPLSRTEILAGKALACASCCVAEAIFLLLLGHFVFGVRLENPAGLLLAVGSVTFGFVGLTMWLGLWGRTEQSAAGTGWAVMLMLAMFGGGMMPLHFMPEWMQTIGSLSPVRWSILALEGASWRGFTLAELLLPCGLLFALGLVTLGLALSRLKRQF
jgi:ABC-2 type transport system permease protein